MSRILNEKFSKFIIWTGVCLFIIGIILFFWKSSVFNYQNEINSEKFGQFGDYVSGLIGSLWALAGVILFYVALTEQRKDIQINREALKAQIEEFKLQKQEMTMTRDVFTEQSKTLKKQQFESTFFNSLNLFNNIIENINFSPQPSILYKSRDCFKHIYDDFEGYYHISIGNYILKNFNKTYSRGDKFNISVDIYENIVNKSYLTFFEKHQSNLSHYFRTIYTIIKFVEDNKPENPKYYTNLIRAQLSTYEHLLLFYNCFSDYGEEKFKPLIIKYSLLDNMPTDELLNPEHKSFYPPEAYQ